MKIALVTTTIHVPKALALIAAGYPDVSLFVVGDRKTPDNEVVRFLESLPCEHRYYGIDRQYKLGWEVVEHIPENCIQRRSIGFLEALKWGADVVISHDDDNIPFDEYYVSDHQIGLTRAYAGMQAITPTGWFDVGQLLQPKAPHRGHPYDKLATPLFTPVLDAQIGVCAGACLGDPDISAVERIANGPSVHGLSEVLRHGCISDPRQTWTVFNSQNTALRCELLPAWFMFPHVGRMDDIYASLIVQRVMRDKGLCVRFGKPLVFQSRNQHDLVCDLETEMQGMRGVYQLAAFLDHIDSIPVDTHPARYIFQQMRRLSWFPPEALAAAIAWMNDVERVL